MSDEHFRFTFKLCFRLGIRILITVLAVIFVKTVFDLHLMCFVFKNCYSLTSLLNKTVSCRCAGPRRALLVINAHETSINNLIHSP